MANKNLVKHKHVGTKFVLNQSLITYKHFPEHSFLKRKNSELIQNATEDNMVLYYTTVLQQSRKKQNKTLKRSK